MSKRKSVILWILSLLITLLAAYYQRKTGPTYPVDGKVELDGQKIKYHLIRSYGGDDDAVIKVNTKDSAVQGIIQYKRFRSNDIWVYKDMEKSGEELIARIPHQPPAGKVLYRIELYKNDESVYLTEEPVVIRFKGGVPASVLIPHIITMFLAMLISTRAGLEVIFKGEQAYKLTYLTLIFLAIGGLILGPIVQKYAFGDFWTGWPFGGDLTDNKTLVAFIFWLIAFFRQRKDRSKTGWVIVASVVLMIVYLIPHSMFGSEYDYTKGEIKTGQ